MTYAFTGCSGPINMTGGEHTIGWSPANITSPEVTSPIRHGNWLIVPQDWTGAMEEYVLVPYRENPECEGDEPTTLEEHAFGRRPALPDDWVVENIREMMCDLLHVTYRSADWTADIDVYISRQWAVPFHIPWVDPSNTHEVVEATMIDGHPAVLRYDSRGFFNLNMKIYHSSGIKYEVWTRSQSLVSNPQAVIDIARSLYDTPSPTPVAPAATTFRYDTYDTTGAVSTPGSYAFLSNPDDTSTVVTTYEALRDGTTTALLIHTSGADGASQATLYDEVEAGDLFEWHEADDCFVRYKVSEVKPDPTGTVPRKLLAVEWMTYAFTGCSGAVSTDAALSMAWGEMDDLGGEGLVVPVIHGNYQLVPKDWDGDLAESELVLPAREPNPQYVTTLAEARELEFWREPTIPEGWVLYHAYADDVWTGPYYGYTAIYLTEAREYPDGVTTREPAFEISGYFALQRRAPWDAIWHNGGHVRETRVIAGRPAVIIYSPSGPNHDWVSHIHIHIYDPATQTEYHFIGDDVSLRGAHVDGAIAIVRSLFESPNAP